MDVFFAAEVTVNTSWFNHQSVDWDYLPRQNKLARKTARFSPECCPKTYLHCGPCETTAQW
jgi:hypothetical protein